MSSSTSRPSAALLCGAILLSATGLTQAGDPVNLITVSTLVDGVDEFDGKCSLREAVRNASLNQSSPVAGECASGSVVLTDEIVLLGGATYNLTVTGSGNDGGDLDLFQNAPLPLALRIRSSNASQVTIRQMLAGQRVIENTAIGVELNNIMIRGGSIDGAGGGILNSGGTISLDAVNVFSNSATAGGGIYNSGTINAVNSQLQLNTASFIGGGAIFNTGNGDIFLDNVMLRANTAPAGGAVYNEGDELLLLNGCAVSLNQATGSDGGAIINLGAGRLRIVRGLFENNTAQNDGGAIFTSSSNAARIFDSSFVNHNAVRGGAIAQNSSQDVEVTASVFTGNSAASHGGAIFAGNAKIHGSQFVDNSSFLGHGGALYGGVALTIDQGTVIRGNDAVEGGGIDTQLLFMRDSRVEMNQATGVGGGIRITNNGTIMGSKIVGNTASGNGAGLFTNTGGLQTTLVQRSLFMNNTTTAKGGGMWLGSAAQIGNTTITLNGANNGGGGLYINDTANVLAVNITLLGHLNGQDLHKFGTLTLRNSIISTPGQPDCTTSIDNVEIISLGNNIADDASCFGLTQPSDRNNTEPLLEVLADTGGSTLTYAPTINSPARNMGNNAGCTSAPVGNVDQRNAPRPFAGTCDIGAHETGAVAPSDLFANGFE